MEVVLGVALEQERKDLKIQMELSIEISGDRRQIPIVETKEGHGSGDVQKSLSLNLLYSKTYR